MIRYKITNTDNMVAEKKENVRGKGSRKIYMKSIQTCGWCVGLRSRRNCFISLRDQAGSTAVCVSFLHIILFQYLQLYSASKYDIVTCHFFCRASPPKIGPNIAKVTSYK
ncbi:hypothetical protein CHS0354_002210 [Potamilus streckersoni]|uniref:Uncharacterized protein n=1 Tax=Potamilus streckersoni TaxID=2493646 RepID=A0AAE0RSQ1_9BIVA|nr:hypothetical protein CHS0354_002210 [Potamilus streckersoni]